MEVKIIGFTLGRSSRILAGPHAEETPSIVTVELPDEAHTQLEVPFYHPYSNSTTTSKRIQKDLARAIRATIRSHFYNEALSDVVRDLRNLAHVPKLLMIDLDDEDDE